MLAPVGLTEYLDVPVAGRQPARYKLYAVIVHAGHSSDAGHYFSFCLAYEGGDGVSDEHGDDGGWWRLDDSSTPPVTAAVVLGRPRQPTETAYTLMYRLDGASTADGQPPALTTLSCPLRAAVNKDNAVYRRSRQGRPDRTLSARRQNR